MIYKVHVKRVVDGDTVVCDIELGFSIVLTDQRVRFLGVNTPEMRGGTAESKAKAAEAKRYVQSVVDGATRCRLVTRGTDTGKERDNFGRILGNLLADDVDLSEALLETGHAVPFT